MGLEKSSGAVDLWLFSQTSSIGCKLTVWCFFVFLFVSFSSSPPTVYIFLFGKPRTGRKTSGELEVRAATLVTAF